MYRYCCLVLSAVALLALGSDVFAQSTGAGANLPDLPILGGKPGAPSVPSILLINTGSALLIQTGSKFLIHN